MHILHKILVHLDDNLPNCDKNSVKDSVKDSVRSYAEYQTEDYYMQAFDWRETESAGGWSHEYPDNVILSRDGLDNFISELEECMESQKSEVNRYLELLSKTSTDIRVLKDASGNVLYYFYRLAELLYGSYNHESGFFDTDDYTAKITDATIQKVKASPKNWALVMFDYHF